MNPSIKTHKEDNKEMVKSIQTKQRPSAEIRSRQNPSIVKTSMK